MPTSTHASPACSSGGGRAPKRLRLCSRTALPPHPSGIRPSLNALLSPALAFSQRRASLGLLAALPDEVLLHLLSLLPAADAARMCAVSRFVHAYAALEGSWRERALARQAGYVPRWCGSWRGTYAAMARGAEAAAVELASPPRADGLCSDALYAPWRLSHLALDVDVPSSLPRLDCSSRELFESHYAGRTPCLLAAADFAARGWDLARLCAEAGEEDVQAEAMRCSPATYLAYAASMRPPYADGILPDESPLYLFDAQLPERLGQKWATPALLDRSSKGKQGEWDHDLFGLLGDRRPDYRWVIAGPERSGSGWHKDPNATSAWNTILSGSKHWLFLPPHVTPPGVFVSHDEAEVTAPLSLAEWGEGYLAETRRRHGRQGDATLLEGRCAEGETVYVPTGWWHCVVNTSECVAFTQNLVSRHELGAVLDFMKNRPTHVSGFKRSPSAAEASSATASASAAAAECSASSSSAAADAADADDDEAAPAELYSLFCARLRAYDAELLEAALAQVAAKEAQRRGRTTRVETLGSGWWRRMKREAKGEAETPAAAEGGEAEAQQQAGDGNGGGGGFAGMLGEEELEAVPW